MKTYCHLLTLALSVTLASGLSAEDKGANPNKDANELAKFLFTVTEVILDHDLNPPTRQELIYHCVRKAFVDAKGKAPRTLSRQISTIGDSGELATVLSQLFSSNDLPALNSEPAGLLRGLQSPFFPTGEFRGASYVNPKESKVSRQLGENRYIGIGIALGMTQIKGSKTSQPRVMKVLGKGPAYYAGLTARDVIEEIDGRDTRDIPMTKIIQWLRGANGTKVKLIARQSPGKPARTMVITRAVVPIQSAVGHAEDEPGEHIYGIPTAPELAYVRVNQVTGATLNELQNLEPRFIDQGIRGIILDLRFAANSRDHDLHHAVMLADGLLPGGEMGTIFEGDSVRRLKSGPDSVFRGLPMAVLLGPGTSPSAAWISALLQDGRHAYLIGQPTDGRTQVSSAVPIPDYGGSLLLSTSRFERSKPERSSGNRKQTLPPRRPNKPDHRVIPDRVIESKPTRITPRSGAQSKPNVLDQAELKAAIKHLTNELR
jgi:C-terminal processing protease CtpA/Prc